MHERQPRKITYAAAIREASDQCMDRDSRIILVGEGVPDPKAIFGTTKDLQVKYGSSRVFDMPLAENGMTGICIGAALAGLRPVMIHQRLDFMLLAMDQIVNNAAKWHYMFDGKASIPIVIRSIIGRGWGQGPQHSQSLQAMFAQVPGLKVVMPTTAYDAKGMMISAIEDDNPIIFIEHRWLHHIEDIVPEEFYRTPIGQARLLHEGDKVTIAAFSYMAIEALEAARALSRLAGITLDVLDMRTARPLDVVKVIESVSKTGRLLVVDTGCETGSISCELISQVTERAFGALKAPPKRIASPDYPVPTSHYMAEGYYPDAEDIAIDVFEMLGYGALGHIQDEVRVALKRTGRHDSPSRDFVGPF